MSVTDPREPLPVAGPALMLRGLLGLALLSCALWVIWDLPAARGLVAVASLAYAGLLWRWPHAWAVALPALIPLYDLGLWTGRYILTEFDALILITLARHYARPASRPVVPPLTGRAGVLAGLLLLSCAASVLIAGRGIGSLVPQNINFYLEPLNAPRVAKGLLAAWLLWPLLRAARREGAHPLALLMTGFALAGLVFGLTSMWERGLFRLLAEGASPAALASEILGFSGLYRITGLFSGMHVGGTATDGFLALAVPMGLGGAMLARRLWLRILCAFGAAMALYAAMLTVSRGLLAGVALALLLLGAWFWRTHVRQYVAGGAAALSLAPLAVTAGCSLLAFRFGGNEAVAEVLLMLGLAAAVPRLTAGRLFKGAGIAAWAVILVAGHLMLYESFAESRWSTLGDGLKWPVAAGLAITVMACGGWIGHLLRRVPAAILAGGFAACVGVAAIMLPAVAGSSMTTRLARSEADMGGRQNHWGASLETVTRSPQSLLWGMGVGSYPTYYLTLPLGEEDLATGLVLAEGGHSFMRQGEGDFSIAQRVTGVRPGREYVFSGRLRGDGAKKLSMRLCPRNVLLFHRYTPECVGEYLPAATPDWQAFEITLNSGDLGRFGPLYLPVTLQLYNGASADGGLVDYTDLQLRPAGDGDNLIANGDFSSGIDRWFMVSDFSHLAWHTKNVFLHMLFEQGVPGLVLFAGLLGLGLVRGAGAALDGQAAGAALAGTLASLAVTGFFGTMVDNPTVALVIYLVMLAAADLPALQKDAGKNPPLGA